MVKQPNITPVECQKRGFAHNQCYKLVDHFFSRFTFKGSRYQVVINKGFLYDGASIPWFLWTIIRATPDGLHRAATILHDKLYIEKGVVQAFCINENYFTELVLTRKEVDKIFLEQMLEAKVPRRKAKAMYRGVRLFGGFLRRF